MKMTIRNKILIWFMSISLIPLILIAFTAMAINRQALSERAFSQLENVRVVKTDQIKAYIEERNTDLGILMDTLDGLRQAAFNKLKTVQENKKAQVLTHFHNIAKDIDVISKSTVVLRAITDFKSVIDHQGEFDSRLYDFFETEKYGDTLVKFRDTYGYHDLMLVDAGGRVVYSSKKGAELGKRLISQSGIQPRLSHCFNRGKHGFHYCDFAPDGGGSPRYTALFATPVHARDQRLLGVVVLKITPDALNEIMLRNQGMGDTGESYLAFIKDGTAWLRTQRPLTGQKVGDQTQALPNLKALFSTIKPVIRVKESGESEIAIFEPVPVFGISYLLSTRMALNEVIDPRRQDTTMDYFSKFIRAYGYENLYLISPGGKIFYSAKQEAGGPEDLSKTPTTGLARLHQKIIREKQSAFVDFMVPENGNDRPYAYIGAPLVLGGRIDMIAALKLPVDGFNRIMQIQKGWGATAGTYLVGPDKRLRSDIILLPDPHSVAASFSPNTKIRIDTPPVRLALAGRTGKQLTWDYRNKPVLSAYAPIDIMGTTWAVLAEVDKKEAFASLNLFIVVVIATTLLTTALIFLLSLYAAKRISAPVLSLTAAAQQVQNRIYDIHVDVDTKDEHRLLADAFNDMTRMVKQRSDALELKIRQLKTAESEIRASEERFRSLVETTSDWIWEVDSRARYTYASPQVTTILGYLSGEIIGKTPFELMPAKEQERVAPIFSAFVARGESFSGLENVNLHKRGHWVSLETSGVPFFDDNGTLLGYRGIDRDISQRKQNEEALLLTESVFTNTIEGIVITDRDGMILRVNQAFCDITGYSCEEAVGQNPRILKSDRHDDAFYAAMWSQILERGQWSGEIWNRRKDGSAYPEWLSISAIRNESGEISNFVSLFHDISEKKLREEKLQFLAFHDPLTRLPNRKLLYDRAAVSLKHARRSNGKMALLYMDLDNFKNINDSYGHPFGDEFLIQVKNRIQTICRESDTFARYGGDEFVIVLSNINHKTEVIEFANRILELFKTPVTIMEEEVFTSVSIGLAIFPDDGDTLVTLEKHADMALYEAKRDGKRRSFHFQPALKDKMLRKIRLENALRQAIRDFDTFDINYQPKLEVNAGHRIHGVEALLRWQMDGTPVSPAEFIPVAEETNLIIPIGEWLLQKTMTDIKSIHDAGWPRLSLAINLSTKQFNDDNLLPLIRNTIKSVDFNPARLCFEITESIPMANTQNAVNIMEALRGMGIQLSMDDFGTGYSSLSVLKGFPLNELKIDRSFIKDLPGNTSDAAICRTIIHMAEALGFRVVAEGVETIEQLDFCKAHDCRLIQGYFFHPPLPLDKLRQILTAHTDFSK